ncbi:hypothetical protein HH310_25335 [Actinoplanes sp. TBRC 11911]|uniref:hypothetical protein n=1 Tax=Actinoplanes sp. TBRC 11911 TaxID=2729386 RepID=UPI00145D7AAE|nr:hypothetical protein [Actinoplanes sp. TBRC 11911]NMO54496.1 hypothetical protein [Actinoplanes sp. TBRC 11911]
MDPDTLPPIDQIDPMRFTALLEQAGWRLIGGRRGLYNRLAPPSLADTPDGVRSSILIPLDRQAPDYSELIRAAIHEVQGTEDGEVWHRQILPRIVARAADQFQFRRQTEAPAGLIPWDQGEYMIKSVRGTLAAGAKSYIEKKRRFSNRLGQFSNRFLETIYMGQTAVGSYIVTAYAPTDSEIPVNRSMGNISPGDSVARGRDVTQSVSRALEATVEAIDHYHRTNSLAGFDAGIENGISHELSYWLEEFASRADESDIRIVWDSGVDLLQPPELASPISTYAFTRQDANILGRAARYLADDPTPATHEVVIGRVHVASKKRPGDPGVFGLEVSEGPVRKVQVRLRNALEYHRATRALDQDLILAISGNLERDGNQAWLYNAEILFETTSVAQANAQLGLPAPVEGLELFDDSSADFDR